MNHRRSNRTAVAALAVAVLALVASTTGLAGAARQAVLGSATPKPGGLLRLDRHARFPARAIPTVARARKADKLGDKGVAQVTPTCAPTTVDLGTWCLMASPYPLTNEDIGRNDYFFATQACIDDGGYLPTAAQLIGAAARVKLASVVDDDQLSASIDVDATDGLGDRREMSGTLVTTAAGSTAAGSEGVSDKSKGDPKQGQPDPTPLPANPSPQTLQYVTVYDNHDKGGFAGSKPVGQPENFRCAYDKAIGAAEEGGG